MTAALVTLVRGLGQLLNAFYANPDRETVELISACIHWLARHDPK